VADSWQQLGELNLDALIAAAEAVAQFLDTLATAMELLAAALRLLAAFLVEDINAIKAAIDALIDTLENTIEDFLQNNVGVTVHINLNWDPTWSWKKGWFNRAVEERQRPWRGSGLDGWLLDIAFSAEDTSDPYRPLTDEETEVMGIIFLKGIPADGAYNDLLKIFDAFTDWDSEKELLDEAKLDKEELRALFRLGPACMSDFMEECASIPNTLLGKVTRTTGSDGESFSGENRFVSEGSTFTIHGVVAGDTLSITSGSNEGDYTVTSVLAETELYIATVLNYDSSGDTFEIIGKENPDSTFLPVKGAYPKWLSVPLASLLPPLREAFDVLKGIVDKLKLGAGRAEKLAALADLLAKKAELLAEAADRLQSIVETLVGVLEFFFESHTIFLSKQPGGFSNFIARAQNAENVPDFGSNGIVVGAVIVATADDPANHLEGFLGFLGMQVDTLTDSQTARAENLADQYDELF
jgi:hypothetical protein